VSVQARAQDYAAAIYELAFEPWTRQLRAVQEALITNVALRSAMDDPTTPTQDKVEMLNRVVPSGFSAATRRFVGTLLDAGQLGQLPAILAEFEGMVRRHPERQQARVTSAVPLEADEQEALRTRLTDRYAGDLEVEFEVDPTLLGGIRLRVGDQVIDGSVAARLAAMRDELTK
jgi:F-type H+-transporting ATPase subunit delta